jgi:hypothetical protein
MECTSSVCTTDAACPGSNYLYFVFVTTMTRACHDDSDCACYNGSLASRFSSTPQSWPHCHPTMVAINQSVSLTIGECGE